MWPRIASVAAAVWLMAAPAVLGYGDPARTVDRIVGPLAAAVAFVAAWEVMRGLRWGNLLFSVWLLSAPWILGYGERATANGVGVGLVLFALGFIGGRTRQRFGGGWSMLVAGARVDSVRRRSTHG